MSPNIKSFQRHVFRANVSGPSQRSWEFNGTDEAIVSTNTCTAIFDVAGPFDDGTNDYLFSVWFKPTDETPAAVQGIWGSTSQTRNYHLNLMTDGKLRFSWTGPSGQADRRLESTSAVAVGWNHTAIRFHNDGGAGWDAKMWLNGSLDGTRAAASPYITTQWTAHPFSIGRSGGSYFTGKISQFALFGGSVFTDNQCAAFYGLGPSTNLVATVSQPFFYLRGRSDDDLAAAGGVLNSGSSTEVFSGVNMTTAANLTTDIA